LSLIVVNELLEILRCEIYFDTSAMIEKSLSASIIEKEKDHDSAEKHEIPTLVRAIPRIVIRFLILKLI